MYWFDARPSRDPLQLGFGPMLLEVQHLTVVVHAHCEGGPNEDVGSLERQSLRLVAHKDISNLGIVVLNAVVSVGTGGVELQRATVTPVLGVDDFPEGCHEPVVPDAEDRLAVEMQGPEKHPVR